MPDPVLNPDILATHIGRQVATLLDSQNVLKQRYTEEGYNFYVSQRDFNINKQDLVERVFLELRTTIKTADPSLNAQRQVFLELKNSSLRLSLVKNVSSSLIIRSYLEFITHLSPEQQKELMAAESSGLNFGLYLAQSRNPGAGEYSKYLSQQLRNGVFTPEEVLTMLNSPSGLNLGILLAGNYTSAIVSDYLQLLRQILSHDSVRADAALAKRLAEKVLAMMQYVDGSATNKTFASRIVHCTLYKTEVRYSYLKLLQYCLESGAGCKEVLNSLMEQFYNGPFLYYVGTAFIVWSEKGDGVLELYLAILDQLITQPEAVESVKQLLSFLSRRSDLGTKIAYYYGADGLKLYFSLLEKWMRNDLLTAEETMALLMGGAENQPSIGTVVAEKAIREAIPLVLNFLRLVARGLSWPSSSLCSFFGKREAYHEYSEKHAFIDYLASAYALPDYPNELLLTLFRFILAGSFDYEQLITLCPLCNQIAAAAKKQAIDDKKAIDAAGASRGAAGSAQDGESNSQDYLYELALKSQDSFSTFGFYLCLARYGHSAARADKKALSVLGEVLQEEPYLTRVLNALKEGAYNENQMKGLAFLKEALAKKLVASNDLILIIQALNPNTPLGRFFYIQRGNIPPDRTKGQLAVLAVHVSEPNILRYIEGSYCSSEGLRLMNMFRKELAEYLGTLPNFWDYYVAAMRIETPLGRYYWFNLASPAEELNPSLDIMAELNQVLAKKPALVYAKLQSREIPVSWYEALTIARAQQYLVYYAKTLTMVDLQSFNLMAKNSNHPVGQFFAKDPASLLELESYMQSGQATDSARRGGFFSFFGYSPFTSRAFESTYDAYAPRR